MRIASNPGMKLGFRYPPSKTGTYYSVPSEGVDLDEVVASFALQTYPSIVFELESNDEAPAQETDDSDAVEASEEVTNDGEDDEGNPVSPDSASATSEDGDSE